MFLTKVGEGTESKVAKTARTGAAGIWVEQIRPSDSAARKAGTRRVFFSTEIIEVCYPIITGHASDES